MPGNMEILGPNGQPSQGRKGKGSYKMPKWEMEEDIVISGFSGRFPEANNVEELKKNLFEGIDMITENDRRWKPGIFGTPKRMGKLKEIDKFDLRFFGVHDKQAQAMDPMHRLFLEATYEAIFDSGYDPSYFKGENVGVYVGCSDRSMTLSDFPEDFVSGYELLGGSIAMLPNRASFTFGFTGPSMSLDTACSSTLHAFNEAVLALRNNRCQAAIVGGACISLSATVCISFTKLGLLSPDGTCKVFDDTANGYVRSEAVGAIFLQRASNARRCYATVLHCKLNNDGAKPEGISFPSAAQQTNLLKEVFSELDISPTDVSYVEAHGTGTVAGDREESNVIANFFCPGRNSPLLVGSIKSNLGHAEAASGTCTISKVLLSMEEGAIPPNLHYSVPNQHVPALLDGRIKIVSEKTPWTPGIVAANNFGFGGSNASLILKPNPKESPTRPERLVPRLALVSGRTEEAVAYIFKKIQEDHFPDEALVLLEEACKAPTNGMKYRGYALVQTPGAELSPTVELAPPDKRQVWFLFSGMGSQWSEMVKDMMKLQGFAKSISSSAQVLRPYGVDLLYLLTEATEQELNHIIAPFVTIAAVQIALVDLVKSLGIIPDGIVGHSVGELGCAYADGCLSSEQMLLAAYWRGKSCSLSTLTLGAMAAVGLSWEETMKRCPDGVYPVCHNAEDSVTISGPADKVKEFVQNLNADKVFAKIVKTCDIAFHSKYVEPASLVMRKELSKVIPNPLPRSAKWISSSVPEVEWTEPHAQLSSAEYHVNNLLSPVLFKEAMTKVPKNAIVVEFAPHSLLQAIVKRILGSESIYIGLMNNRAEDNLLHFLNSIGKMYTSSLNPSAKNLYEKIEYPVPRGTPMLNSLIYWDHSYSLLTVDYNKVQEMKDLVMYDTIRGGPNEYLTGHKVDGRVLFPFAGYVFLAWKALAKHFQFLYDEVSVIVEDLSVFRATILPKDGTYIMAVTFVSSDGSFRISEGGSIVATGNIRKENGNVLQTVGENFNIPNWNEGEEENFVLNAAEFYKELRLRGYEYGPTFQGVLNASSNGFTGKIKWNNNWITFMDAMLQVPILCIPVRALLLPIRVKFIHIDVSKKPTEEEVLLEFNPYNNICRAGPVEVHGLDCGIAPKRRNHSSDPVLEEQVFDPIFDSCILTKEDVKEVQNYAHACSTLAHKIIVANGKDNIRMSSLINGFNKAEEELIESLLKKEDNSYVILKLLKEILDPENITNDTVKLVDGSEETINTVDTETNEQSKEKKANGGKKIGNGISITSQTTEDRKNKVNEEGNVGIEDNTKEDDLQARFEKVYFKHLPDVQNDLLCTRILTERALRSALDIVQDNHFSTKMKILEVSVNAIVCKPILKMLNLTLGLMKYDYLVARTNEDVIPDGLIDASVKTLIVNVKENPLPANHDLVVAKDLFTDNTRDGETLFQAVVTSLKPKGFFLLMERTYISPAENFISILRNEGKRKVNESYLEEMFQENGLRLISKKKDRKTSVLYLLRKNEESRENNVEPLQIDASDEIEYTWVDELRDAMKENAEKSIKRTIWLYSSNPCCGLVGFVNCLKQEPGGQNIRYIFNCHNSKYTAIPSFTISEPYYQDIISKDLVVNVFKDQEWGMFRHRLIKPDPKQLPRKRAFLDATKRGDLSSMTWIENVPVPEHHDEIVSVEIYYSSLNFRDVMLASGKLPIDASQGKSALQECVLGLEFVGRDPDGRRVMGIAPSKALATSIYVPKNALMEVPSQWTMEEASTVPVVYLTSYYALMVRGQMRSGESILIHSGTGGVGQAAISIALSMGCKVFATVGTDKKREALKEIFPELEDDQIFSSRDIKFEYEIMRATKGQGVDLVLNSLADDKLQASVRCLKMHGRFLEIGKYDIFINSNLGMAALKKNISFHAVFLDLVSVDSNKDVFTQLQKELMDGVRKGVVRPLRCNVFSWDQGEEAFRFMASGQHIGKVVIKIRDEESERAIRPNSVEIPCVPRTYCNKDKSYVVTGGLGGFGFELTSWLVERGAKKVVLSARSPIKNHYQRLWVQRWKNEGCQVLIANQDLSSEEGCKTLLEEALNMGPVGGIYHLAMVLSDGLFENLKSEDFQKVSLPKVQGVHRLDRLSRELCPTLDYFVVFSSISCGRGNPGQSNYGYANSVMERVIERRVEDGLPGLAIQWGGIGDVGVVYEKMGGNEVILKGTVPQRLNSCLALMDKFIHDGHAVVSSFVPVEKAAFGGGSREDMIATLCKVLGIKDPSSVKPEMTLGELGMDSLMGVEIKQVLETEYDTVLSVPEVRQLSMRDLEEIEKRKNESFSLNGRSEEPRVSNSVKDNIFIPTEISVPLNDSKDPQCVFFVHSLEGHVNLQKSLAHNIKCKVYGLQFTENVACDKIEDIAACYTEQIKEVQPHGPYRLVGYSFGSLIAFEIALQLQKTDHVKSFVCIDGSPKVAKEMTNIYLRTQDFKNWHTRNEAINICLRIHAKNVPEHIQENLLHIPKERISVDFQSALIPYVGQEFQVDVAERIGERIFHLCNEARRYTPSKKCIGRVTLIKPNADDNPEGVKALAEYDYGLKENVEGSVEVFSIKCERQDIIFDTSNEISKIINDRI